jgi:hypothetical protein
VTWICKITGFLGSSAMQETPSKKVDKKTEIARKYFTKNLG